MTILPALVLALASQVQAKPVREAPDPARVEAAVAELTAAFGKEGTAAARVEAIEKGREVLDARVIEAIARGLADKDPGVTGAAVDALGRMPHPVALDALHGWYRRERKKLAEDLTLLPAALKAIGRHGSASSIPILREAPFDQRAYPAAQARVMALGNIRANAALEELIDLSKKVGVHRLEGVRQDMRVAIAQLTGLDLGPDSTAWLKWWQDNKRTFRVPEAPPKLEGPMQRQWERYWGTADKGRDEDEPGSGGGRRRRGGDGGGPDGG